MPFFHRTAPAVVWATLGVALYMYVRGWTLIAVVDSFHLHITDLLFAFTMVYCLAGGLERWRHSPLEYLNLSLCLVLAMNFGRGLVGLNVDMAGNEFRELYSGYVAASLFIYLMYRHLDGDWILDKVALLGWALALLSVARLALGPGVFSGVPEEDHGSFVTGYVRTLSSEAALMLGIAGLIVLRRMALLPPGSKRRRKSITFLVFMATLLISQERTATFATLGGIGVITATLPRRQRSIVLAAGGVAAVIGGAIVYVGWIAIGGDFTPYLPLSITEMGSAESTYAWRVQQWQEAIDLFWQAPLIDQMIGLPLGFSRFLASRSDIGSLQYDIHSEYIGLLKDSGIVGVVLFVSMLFSAILKGVLLLRDRTGSNACSRRLGLALAIVVSYAVYSYTYALSNEQGLLLAIALQMIATTTRFSATSLSRLAPPRAASGRESRDWR